MTDKMNKSLIVPFFLAISPSFILSQQQHFNSAATIQQNGGGRTGDLVSVEMKSYKLPIFSETNSQSFRTKEKLEKVQNVQNQSSWTPPRLSPEFVRNHNNNNNNNNNFENLQHYFDSLAKEKEKEKPSGLNEAAEDSKIDQVLFSTRRPTRRPGQARTTSRRTTRRPYRTTRKKFTTTTTLFPPPTPTRRPRTTTTTLTTTTATASSDSLTPVDATWILICAFIIFTMQTGFGLLEAGIVSLKNETNIMMKNATDVVLGGFSYWIFGYGITYGTWYGSSSVFGIGYYAVDASIAEMGDVFTSFFFQLSFATTATTIVSGAVAERCNFKAYCLYSLFSTITYSVQARWVWGPGGWLGELGAVDIAGSGSVHLVGGASAFVAAWFLGPRLGRYEIGIGGHGLKSEKEPGAPPLGNPLNVLMGLFFLWWGWFAFNAGSTYGVTEDLWKFSARGAASTIIASIGGGMVGLLWGFVKPSSGKTFEVLDIVNSVLGALVGITAGCAVFHTCEAFFTGVIGAIVVIVCGCIPDLLKIDDPVGATGVHGFGGIWGLIAVGIFAENDEGILGVTKGRSGLVRGGGWYLLGVQVLTAVAIIVWSMVSTFIILLLINIIVPLRVEPHEELLGLDFCEHGIRRGRIGMSPALSLFGSHPEVQEIHTKNAGVTGQDNPAHEKITETLRDVRIWKPSRRRRLAQQQQQLELDPKSPTANRRKMKAAVLFARAFKKLQNKDKSKAKNRNKVKPRDQNYILHSNSVSASGSLKSSTESLIRSYNHQLERRVCGNKPEVKVQNATTPVPVPPPAPPSFDPGYRKVQVFPGPGSTQAPLQVIEQEQTFKTKSYPVNQSLKDGVDSNQEIYQNVGLGRRLANPDTNTNNIVTTHKNEASIHENDPNKVGYMP